MPKVDVWGDCGKRYNQSFSCLGPFTWTEEPPKGCLGLTQYKFYLAFENSLCLEYVTEKPWWNAIAMVSVKQESKIFIFLFSARCPCGDGREITI